MQADEIQTPEPVGSGIPTVPRIGMRRFMRIVGSVDGVAGRREFLACGHTIDVAPARAGAKGRVCQACEKRKGRLVARLKRPMTEREVSLVESSLVAVGIRLAEYKLMCAVLKKELAFVKATHPDSPRAGRVVKGRLVVKVSAQSVTWKPAALAETGRRGITYRSTIAEWWRLLPWK